MTDEDWIRLHIEVEQLRQEVSKTLGYPFESRSLPPNGTDIKLTQLEEHFLKEKFKKHELAQHNIAVEKFLQKHSRTAPETKLMICDPLVILLDHAGKIIKLQMDWTPIQIEQKKEIDRQIEMQDQAILKSQQQAKHAEELQKEGYRIFMQQQQTKQQYVQPQKSQTPSYFSNKELYELAIKQAEILQKAGYIEPNSAESAQSALVSGVDFNWIDFKQKITDSIKRIERNFHDLNNKLFRFEQGSLKLNASEETDLKKELERCKEAYSLIEDTRRAGKLKIAPR